MLLIAFLMGNLGCSKECGFAFADLIADIAIGGLQTIVAGQPFSIPNTIENVANTVETCSGDLLETETAGASQSMIQIDYDVNGNGSFSQNEISSNFNVDAIPAGGQANEGYMFSFDQPGDYRLITFADDNNDVEERNESNNTSPTATVSSGGRLSADQELALIIRVLPNPEYTRPEGAPFVRLLSRTVEYSWK